MYLLPVNSASDCTFKTWDNIWFKLDNCLTWSNLVQPVWMELKINSWFKDSILKWVKNLSIFFSIMAVGSIVYWAFMLTISAWEDERIKKWKDIVKWWMIWFLAIISAGWLIAVVINFVYTVAK